MEKIIAVRGIRNTGKTTSIKIVPDLLKKKYPSAILIDIPNTLRKDIIVKAIINGVTIIIVSAGDPVEGFEERLKEIANMSPDILVCATRSRGATVTMIESYSPTPIIWIEKDSSPSKPKAIQEAENEATAYAILDHIEQGIKSLEKMSYPV
jgi:phage tail sheath gpL-like